MPRRTDHLDAMRREMGEIPSPPMPAPPSPTRTSRVPATSTSESYGTAYAGVDPGDGGFSLAGFLTVVCVIGLMWWFGGNTVQMWSNKIADNAAVGTCIPTKQAWDASSSITPIECEQPHWGEVLGYPILAATPSPYPGDDQAKALARFHCGLLFAQRGLDPNRYDYTDWYRNRENWNAGSGQSENYATCVVTARDGNLPAGQLVRTDQAVRLDVPVMMNVWATRIDSNAPAGVCVATREGFDASVYNVPVVPCEQRHWAEILGYYTLYPPTSTWPGEEKVYADADAACRRAITDRRLPPQFSYRMLWPPQATWSAPERNFYTTCLAFRSDNQQFSGPMR